MLYLNQFIPKVEKIGAWTVTYNAEGTESFGSCEVPGCKNRHTGKIVKASTGEGATRIPRVCVWICEDHLNEAVSNPANH